MGDVSVVPRRAVCGWLATGPHHQGRVIAAGARGGGGGGAPRSDPVGGDQQQAPAPRGLVQSSAEQASTTYDPIVPAALRSRSRGRRMQLHRPCGAGCGHLILFVFCILSCGAAMIGSCLGVWRRAKGGLLGAPACAPSGRGQARRPLTGWPHHHYHHHLARCSRCSSSTPAARLLLQGKAFERVCAGLACRALASACW